MSEALGHLTASLRDDILLSLVDTDRWLGRSWMRLLQRLGHFAAIRTADEFVRIVSEGLGNSPSVQVKGSVIHAHYCASTS